jgi:hypothetical protein
MNKIGIILALMLIFSIALWSDEITLHFRGEVHEDAHPGDYVFEWNRNGGAWIDLFTLNPGDSHDEYAIISELPEGTTIRLKSSHASFLINDKFDNYTAGVVHPSTIEFYIYWPSTQYDPTIPEPE